MAAALFYLVALAALAAAALRLARLRTSPNRPAAQAYCLILIAMAVAFATMATPTQAWINRHLLDGGKVLGNVCALIAAFGVVALNMYTRWPTEQAWPRVRWRLVLLLAAVAVLVVTFFWPHPVPLTGSFDGLYARDPSLALYTTVYALYLGHALLDHVRLSWQFARSAPPFLRWGLRLLAVAGVLGVAYAASKLAIVVQRLITGSTEQPGNEAGVCHSAFDGVGCTVAVGGPGIVALLIVAGVVACAFSARLEGLAQWTATLRSLRRLEPLWRAITKAVPEVRSAGIADESGQPREASWRLERRYVEIRDGLLLLSPYRTPDPTAVDHDAAVEAAMIAEAIAAKQAGVPPRNDVPAAALAAPSAELGLEDDTAWLEEVATEFAARTRRGRPAAARQEGAFS
ncbi:MAB_1171c family putative transporter [Amycolatopsis methanolica]|uniref:MAB_1171c family putative transporter n=1 Tax=Amycolatopsis methanolica TaxID=1814 RepID=UPI00343D9D72